MTASEAAATRLAPWEEPARGGFPAPSLFLGSGLDQLRAIDRSLTGVASD
jgi:hypothetical protein